MCHSVKLSSYNLTDTYFYLFMTLKLCNKILLPSAAVATIKSFTALIPVPHASMKRPRTEPPFHPDATKDPEFEDFDEAKGEAYGQPPSSAVPSTSAGFQLTGLVCPHCRMIYHDVESLKNHIATSHRTLQQHVAGREIVYKGLPRLTFLNGPTPASFIIYFRSFSNIHHYNFYNKYL